MEGREHTGLLLVVNSSADPERQEEWNRWYVDKHMPDALRPGLFGFGARFRLAAGSELPNEATHVALYETTEPSVPDAFRALTKALAAEPPEKRPPSNRALAGTYTRISQRGDATGKRANGLVLVWCNCTDPTQEDAFNAWYEEHGQHVLDNGEHHAVTRYVADDPKPWQAKYLAVYETEADPAEVLREGNEWYARSGHTTPKFLSLWCEVAVERDA